MENLNSFCRKYQIRELSLFGSVLGEAFKDDSDVDILVSFLPGANPNLVDLDEMRVTLEALFGRKVDMVEAEAIRNPFRRYSILKDREKVYAA
jgi:predicted nucleotidyltransferase